MSRKAAGTGRSGHSAYHISSAAELWTILHFREVILTNSGASQRPPLAGGWSTVSASGKCLLAQRQFRSQTPSNLARSSTQPRGRNDRRSSVHLFFLLFLPLRNHFSSLRAAKTFRYSSAFPDTATRTMHEDFVVSMSLLYPHPIPHVFFKDVIVFPLRS